MSSHYGSHSRAWRAWRMEERKKHFRRFCYHILDDLGFFCWMMVFVVGVACVLFLVAHR